MALIGRLLPPDAGVGELFGDEPEPLFAQEEAYIARAVHKRRSEFRSVRGCARVALSRLNLDRPPLVPGPGGEPPWPRGVVGAMTHCEGYRAAAVARADTWAGLGIDAEPHAPLPAGILRSISAPDERRHLDRLAQEDPDTCWDRMLFSAKESVFKVWYPLVGTWLGFEEARVMAKVTGTFEVELVADVPPHLCPALSRMSGRWIVDRGLVLTAVLAPAVRGPGGGRL